ncbi:hypothetical protein NIB75_12705 [Bacteroides uniformis]|nr:hypothetical protein [Bacteroides uniformis]
MANSTADKNSSSLSESSPERFSLKENIFFTYAEDNDCIPARVKAIIQLCLRYFLPKSAPDQIWPDTTSPHRLTGREDF